MTQESGTARLTVPVSQRDHQQGPATAPVTVVEYGDYECPYCGQAYPIVKEIQRRLGERLRFVFRNFPLTQSHPHAQHAAAAVEAAAVLGKFWEMHDSLTLCGTGRCKRSVLRLNGAVVASVRERAACQAREYAQLPPTHATSPSAPRSLPSSR